MNQAFSKILNSTKVTINASKTLLAKLLLVILATFCCLKTYAAVWETTKQWDTSWEQKYQAWVIESWDKDFFTKNNPYKGLRVDCADAVYTMRLAFAAENGLPFAIKDPTGGSQIISNNMTRWDSLAPSARQRSLLQYIFGVGSTKSLPADSYPVADSRSTMTPGTFLLSDAASHHSWTLQHISHTGIPFLVYSSRPAKNVMLTRFEYPTTGFTFKNGNKAERHVGFRAFRHPEHLLVPVWEVPGYSLRQYSIPLNLWAHTLQNILKLKDESPDELVSRVTGAVCQGSKERVDYVNEALSFLAKTGNRCLNATEYDDLSSPSKDLRLKGSIVELRKAYSLLTAKNQLAQLSPQLLDRLKQIFNGQSGDYCSLRITASQALSLGEAIAGFEKNWSSSNPHDALEVRWGLTSKRSELSKKCKAY